MGQRFNNQIAGLIRFSYPAKSGFSKTADDLPELEARLYDPERLERRFRMFEALTMPSLLAQEDSDFQAIVLVGKSMPKPALRRLRDAIAPLKGASIVALPMQHHYYATQRAFAPVWSDAATHHTTFRLDDDDALDRGYIGRLRERAAAIVPISPPDRPLVIGSNRGFFLEMRADGNDLFDVVEKLPLGIGLSMTVPAASDENIFRRNHRIVAQHYSVFTDGDTPAFIRTVHADNDSDPTASGATHGMTSAEIAAEITLRFPFSILDLKNL